MLLANGSVWSTSYDTGVIAQLDPARLELTRIFKDGVKPAGLTHCNGRIWVGHGGATTWLTQIDPATNAVRRVDVGTANPGWPRCIHGPDALIWVTDKERSLVYRVWGGRPSLTDTFDAGPGAYSLARAGDAMWITSFAGSDVRRFER